MSKFLAAVAVLLLTSAAATGPSLASTLILDDTFSYTYSAIEGNGPKITDDLSRSFSIKFNTPISDKNFITAAPAESSGITCGGKGKPSCGNGYDTVSGNLIVKLDFEELEKVNNKTTVLGTGDLSVVGTYVANYDGTADYNGAPCTTSPGNQTDCIVWHNEKTGADSLTIPVTLSDGDSLDVTLFNAQDWDITPKISFDLTDPPAPTPIPGALSLFAGGLGVLGLVGRRRKRIAATA